jgi:hypothetical protein
MRESQAKEKTFDSGFELRELNVSKKQRIPFVIERESPKAYNISELVN